MRRHLADGEPTLVAVPDIFHIVCCDCGLVHLVLTRRGKRRGTVEFTYYRDAHLTKQRRMAKRRKRR